MATSTSAKESAKPTNPPMAAVTGPSDDELLDGWVQGVRARILNPGEPALGKATHGKVDLHERLAAIQWEMGKLKPEAVHFQGYKYHSIQSIENNINRLSAIYRVRITPTRLDSVVLDGGVRLRLGFKAYCWETDQSHEWEWEDDGEDLTKAGSYTQKYGLMKFFHVGDGQDPDAEEARGKPQRRASSTSQARTPTPNGGGKPADPDVKDRLYALAKLLPANAGWPFKDDGSNIKIDAMLRSKMDPSNIEKLIREAMLGKAGVSEPETAAPEATAGEPEAQQ